MWLPVIHFKESILFFDSLIASMPETIYSAILRSQRTVDLHFKPPPNLPLARKNFLCKPDYKDIGVKPESICSEILNNEYLDHKHFFQRACSKKEILFHTYQATYKNVFCFLCSGPDIYGDIDCSSVYRHDTPSFSAILNFDKLSQDVQQGPDDDVSGGLCKCTEYYDNKRKACRRLVCPPGEYFVECACAEYLSNYKQMFVKLCLQVTPLARFSKQLNQRGGRTIKTFTAKMNNVIDLLWGPIEFKYSLLFRQISAYDNNNIKHYLLNGVIFRNNSDERKVMKNVYSALETGIPATILDVPVEISLRPRLNPDKCFDTTRSLPCNVVDDSEEKIVLMTATESELPPLWFVRDMYSQTLSKVMFCRRIYLEEGEITMLHNRSLHQGLTQAYIDNVFREKDGSMCLDDFESIFLRKSSCMETVPNAITVWSLVLSLIYFTS